MDRTSPPTPLRGHCAAESSQSPQRDKTASSSCQSETNESLTLNQSSEPLIVSCHPTPQQRHPGRNTDTLVCVPSHRPAPPPRPLRDPCAPPPRPSVLMPFLFFLFHFP